MGRLWPRFISQLSVPELMLSRGRKQSICSLLGVFICTVGGSSNRGWETRVGSEGSRCRRVVDRRLFLTPDSCNLLPAAPEDVRGLVSGRCSLGRQKEEEKKKEKKMTVWCVTVVKPYVCIVEGALGGGGGQ